MKTVKKNNHQKKTYSYRKFDLIDGRHPLKNTTTDAFIEYPVRQKSNGKIVFFNFSLAKEMGLIDKDHPDELLPELKRKILDTFSLVIINEYDTINNIKYPKSHIKDNTYMATRYLQLQHKSKIGKTSGDGRSIWNGQLRSNGKCWDLSSNGTGATKLSPATDKYNRYFKTGDPTISYGCGCAEVDEGLETLFFSEVLHQNNIPTERVLAVIEHEKNLGVNVRVYPNLLRPSHFFVHLKQSNYQALKKLIDYYIDRQIKEGHWQKPADKKRCLYEYFIEQIAQTYAKMAARFEDDYIFCWLDWDGDNIFMDGGIVDYGSVRQFGLFHYQYRYDDVDRYSTNLLEQKEKARYMVQTFSQLINYIKTGKKRNVHFFRRSKAVKLFEEKFKYYKNYNLLYKIGINPRQIDPLLVKDRKTVEKLKKTFQYFERSKSKRGIVKVSDGLTWDAIFCMRDILRELPSILLSRDEQISAQEFIEIIKSNYAQKKDLKITSYRKNKIKNFQQYYRKIIKIYSQLTGKQEKKAMLEVAMRASVINKYARITGDSISHVSNLIYKDRNKLGPQRVYELLEEFKKYQNLDPERLVRDKNTDKGRDREKSNRILLQKMMSLVKNHREGI